MILGFCIFQMNLSRGLLPLFVFLVAVYIQQFSETECANTPNKINKYCGRNLVNVLTMVCDGVYNYNMPSKDGKSSVSMEDYFGRKIPNNLKFEIYRS